MKNKIGKEKTVIIKNVVIALLVIVFFAGILTVFYNLLCEEKRDNIITKGEAAAYRTSTQFNEYLLTGQTALQMTSHTLDSMLKNNKSNAEIHEYLTGQSDAILNTMGENTTGMYAFINGEYLDGTDWVPPDDYVATERPWYIKAMENEGRITIIDPYIDAQTGDIMITLARSLCDGKSVVSFDFSLEMIQRITEETVSENSYDRQFIVDSNGYVVSHSDKEEVGKEYTVGQDTLESAIMEKLGETDSEPFELYYANSHYVVYTTRLMDDWYCVSVKDATAVFEPLRIILVTTIAAVIIIVLTISIIMGASSKRQLAMERLGNQLSAAADIYISMHEINFVTDTFTEVRNNSSDASSMIGEVRSNCQQMIRMIMTNFSDESTRESILDFVDFSKMNDRLRDRNTVTSEWMNPEKKWRRSRYIVSERTPDGKVAKAMYLIEDIDAEKRERDMFIETLKTMNEQMSSVANIYLSMHDINLPEDTFAEIRTNAPRIEELNNANQGHARKAIFYTMDKMTADISKSSMNEFIDFDTLNERLRDTDTVTEEFLSYRDLWCRARFLVSKRLPDGTIDHVLWLVENIDAEKRRRDRLTEAAMTQTYRVSSISNIYMTVHEVDIINDTFTEIKSDIDVVNDVIGQTRDHAQEVMNKVMSKVTDPAFKDEILKFVNLSTLAKRMRKTDTITVEYMNSDKLWRRGRFIVSRRDDKHRITHVMWLSEDIDEEKKERDKLIDRSERALAASEAKSSFLSNMSHEIRTPINAVLGMNEMILRECDDNNILAYSESIRTAGNTLLGIINDILDFSKIEAGKMEIIPVDYDISSVINDLVNMIQTRADDKGLVLVLDFNKDMPKLLHGDEVRIKQVITNILTNAVKYTEKGSVTFGITYEKIEDEPDAVLLKFSVKDTGIGIKEEDMKKLFSEFERIEEERNRNVEGTGLGMNITQRLLEMMGSSLNVESIYGLGSKFSFVLKQTVVKWEALGDYESAYRESLSERKKYQEKFTAPDANVLVVDDTPMNLMVFRSLLKRTCVKIDTADSGDEGLGLSSDKKYDIIFLDHMMPEKDGIETLHEMRASGTDRNKETPVICLTANAISGAREQYLAAGFDDYLTKPIDSVKLEEMLLEYLPDYKILGPGAARPEETASDGDDDIIPQFVREIAEIDVEAGIRNNGDEEAYIETLRTYAGMVDGHIDDIERFMAADDIENATIKIHALKSTSRIIGAADIGELAQKLETAGKANDTETLNNELGGLLERCRALSRKLSPLAEKPEEAEDDSLPLIREDELREAYNLLKEANASFQLENVNEIAESLKGYRIPDAEKERVRDIIKAVSELEYDKLPEIIG
ncbi:MAG: response regulator [Ruminiclostridium sp.]|nr:response regulator [Ruminiclostridium sp.]